MSEPYEEITLLDCNHKFSSQYKGGNRTSNANYTNKLGSGIQIEKCYQFLITIINY